MPEHSQVPATQAPGPAEPAPEHAAPSGGLLGMQRAVGNAAVLTALGAQPKLSVGAVGDPYEQEADRIARQIVGRLTADTPTADPVAVTRRSPSAGGGAEGGAVDGDVEQAIARSRSGGRPLDPGTLGRMEGAFGADFTGVKVHVDGEADRLNRSLSARAFTLGSDIWFRGGEYQPTTAPGQELLAHELTHVAQQSTTDVARKHGVIQRHASWEHRMLSDVTPDRLKTVVKARDEVRAGPVESDSEPEALVALEGEDGSTIEQAIHVLEEEILVLMAMKDDAGYFNRTEEDAKKKAAGGLLGSKDATLVPVKLSDGTWDVVTYGELNTLADYYGSHEEIGKTAPGNFRAIVKGLRERELRGFSELKAEVSGMTADVIKKERNDDALKFEGAIGDSGRYSSDRAELQLMGSLSGSMKKQELEGAPETSYSGGLARNACHFAPYSWHAWAEHHNKAVALAKQSYAKRKEADEHWDPFGAPGAEEAKKKELTAQADELLRQAMVINGFGDHFLQDSFASGHLVNKTLIMKWFALYLDQHPWDADYATDKSWRAVQATVYAQPDATFGKDLYDSDVSALSTDPQMAENTEGTWKDRFTRLGLAMPRSLADPGAPAALLFKTWQEAASKGKKKITLEDLGKLHHGALVGQDLKNAMLALVQDNVVYREARYRRIKDESLNENVDQLSKERAKGVADYDLRDTFAMRDVYVPKAAPKPKKGEPEASPIPEDQAAYDDRVKQKVHQDYLTFLNRTYLQFSTNVLHNKFCEEGLTIKSGADGELFKVYGDNAMLQKGAADGVAYSAETSRRSLAAIKEWSTTGAVDPTRTVNAIAARFPSHVEFEGTVQTIKDWHAENGPLRNLCTTNVFPGITAFFNKSTLVGNKREVSKVVSKDAGHGGESF